jgi:hypothetical protein
LPLGIPYLVGLFLRTDERICRRSATPIATALSALSNINVERNVLPSVDGRNSPFVPDAAIGDFPDSNAFLDSLSFPDEFRMISESNLTLQFPFEDTVAAFFEVFGSQHYPDPIVELDRIVDETSSIQVRFPGSVKT